MKDWKYLTQIEIDRFFKVFEKEKDYPFWERDRAMFYIIYFCGLRASEVSLLKTNSFNVKRKELVCRRLKNSNDNTIKLNDIAFKLLKDYCEKNNIFSTQSCIFMTKRWNPIDRKRIYKLFNYYANMASLNYTNPHVLKHSIAVHLIESNNAIKATDIQFHLGHKKIENSMVYLRYTATQNEALNEKIKCSERFGSEKEYKKFFN